MDQRLRRLAEERVLGPLGMTNSTYEQPLPPERALHAASGHHDGRVIAGRRHVYPEMAAAGLWTTPDDLAQFLIEIRHAREGRGAHVSKDVAARMTTPVASARGGEVGLGFFLWKKNDGEYFGHNGDDAGFNAMSLAQIGKGYGVVMMANSDDGSRLFPELRRAIAREYAWGGYDPPRFDRKVLAPSALAALEGGWALGDDDGFRLAVREGRLELLVPMAAPDELVPIAPDAFVARASGARVAFARSDGREEILLTEDDGEPQRAKRLANDAASPIFLLDAGRTQEAISMYRKRLRVNPKDPVVARERFRRLAGDLVGERTAEAIRVLEVATALYPESPDAHEWLADACAENGDLTRAHGEYATALRAMSRDPKASADEKTIFRARVTKEMQRAAGIP